jgi:predicted nucleic acid-binding protein
MIEALVIDASLTLSWFLEDEYTEAAEIIRREVSAGSVPWVPPLWPLEVTNSILVICRRSRISEAKMKEIHSLLKALPVEVDDAPSKNAFDDTFTLAYTHKLSAYDAAYLELARRKSLPLATLDRPLREAAKRAGVPLLPEGL